MATFHPFPRLPFELRAMIWKATIEPRTVEVIIDYGRDNLELAPLGFFAPTPIPPPLQTCQEARKLGLYKKEFTELSHWISTTHGGTYGEMRYVWLNLDIDMIAIPKDLLDFQAVRTKIQRLKIHPDWDSETWNGPIMYELHELKDFVNVRELHIVVDARSGFAGMDQFALNERRHLPCPLENTFWVNSEDGQTLSTEEMVRVATTIHSV